MAEEKGEQTNIASPEQIKYATLLSYGGWLGIIIIVITLLIYVGGISEPYIAVSDITPQWGQSAAEYVHNNDIPTGWGWFSQIGYSDFLGLVGIALLALLTVIGYLVLLLPNYLRKKDYIFVGIVLAEITVLSIAASGIFNVGAH